MRMRIRASAKCHTVNDERENTVLPVNRYGTAYCLGHCFLELVTEFLGVSDRVSLLAAYGQVKRKNKLGPSKVVY